jgi:7-cyano-7-deazaguanine synthase
LDTTVYLSSDRKVEIIAPFLNLDKADILNVGYSLQIPVPYHLTRTCYKNQPVSCGRCGSCTERLEAFAKIGKKDPIPYTRA